MGNSSTEAVPFVNPQTELLCFKPRGEGHAMPLIYLLDTYIDFFITGVIFRLFLRNQEVVGSTRAPDLSDLFPEEN